MRLGPGILKLASWVNPAIGAGVGALGAGAAGYFSSPANTEEEKRQRRRRMLLAGMGGAGVGAGMGMLYNGFNKIAPVKTKQTTPPASTQPPPSQTVVNSALQASPEPSNEMLQDVMSGSTAPPMPINTEQPVLPPPVPETASTDLSHEERLREALAMEAANIGMGAYFGSKATDLVPAKGWQGIFNNPITRGTGRLMGAFGRFVSPVGHAYTAAEGVGVMANSANRGLTREIINSGNKENLIDHIARGYTPERTYSQYWFNQDGSQRIRDQFNALSPADQELVRAKIQANGERPWWTDLVPISPQNHNQQRPGDAPIPEAGLKRLSHAARGANPISNLSYNLSNRPVNNTIDNPITLAKNQQHNNRTPMQRVIRQWTPAFMLQETPAQREKTYQEGLAIRNKNQIADIAARATKPTVEQLISSGKLTGDGLRKAQEVIFGNYLDSLKLPYAEIMKRLQAGESRNIDDIPLEELLDKYVPDWRQHKW